MFIRINFRSSKILNESIKALKKEGIKEPNIVFYYNLYERDSFGSIEKSVRYDSNKKILFTNKFINKEFIELKYKLSLKQLKNMIDR